MLIAVASAGYFTPSRFEALPILEYFQRGSCGGDQVWEVIGSYHVSSGTRDGWMHGLRFIKDSFASALGVRGCNLHRGGYGSLE